MAVVLLEEMVVLVVGTEMVPCKTCLLPYNPSPAGILVPLKDKAVLD
jgi:hypothetical protein